MPPSGQYSRVSAIILEALAEEMTSIGIVMIV